MDNLKKGGRKVIIEVHANRFTGILNAGIENRRARGKDIHARLIPT